MNRGEIGRVEEHPAHFVIHHGGGAFRVAKHGLGSALLGRIRMFAKGGEQPDEMPDDALGEPPLAGLDPGEGRGPRSGVTLGEPTPGMDPSGVLFSGQPDPVHEETPINRGLAALRDTFLNPPGGPVDLGALPGTDALGEPPPAGLEPGEGRGPRSGVRLGEPGIPRAETRAAPQPLPMPAAGEPGNEVYLPRAETRAAPTGQAPSPANAGIPIPRPPRTPEIDQAQREEISGARLAGEAAKRQADAQIAAQDALEKHRAIVLGDYKAQLADNARHSDELFTAYRDAKVDPGRLWGSRTFGQKALAIVGLILGGIGSGITGGPNAALGVIDRAVDQDIDAQRANIGKMKGALDHYMQKGRDIESAMASAKADLLDEFGGRLQRAASGYLGDKAAADAMSYVGAIREHSAALRMGVAQNDARLKLEAGQSVIQGLAIDNARLDLAARPGQQAQNALMAQTMTALNEGPVNLPAVIRAALPKEIDEKLVDLPNGKTGLAPSKEEAAKVRDTQATTARLTEKLGRYAALRGRNPRGIWSKVSPTDYAAAVALHSDILSDMGHLHDLQRLTEVDLALFSHQVPDIQALSVFPQGNEEKLSALAQTITTKSDTANAAYIRGLGKKTGVATR